MPFAPFFERFPGLADKETRIVTVHSDDDELPKREYGFVDSYCDEPDCDCRRVFVNVYSGNDKRLLACISYGWEGRAFYRKWGLGMLDEANIDEMRGPSLVRCQPQSPLAPALLDVFRELLLPDPVYVERLKRHYRLFREAVNIEPPDAIGSFGPAARPVEGAAKPKRPGRNAPCPRGSGRKSKKRRGRAEHEE